eukprot:3571375-Prymnesium_polylepis.2
MDADAATDVCCAIQLSNCLRARCWALGRDAHGTNCGMLIRVCRQERRTEPEGQSQGARTALRKKYRGSLVTADRFTLSQLYTSNTSLIGTYVTANVQQVCWRRGAKSTVETTRGTEVAAYMLQYVDALYNPSIRYRSQYNPYPLTP